MNNSNHIVIIGGGIAGLGDRLIGTNDDRRKTFISDHMEVVYDLDTEAKAKAAELGMTMVRAKTAGTHPRFVTMIRAMVTQLATNYHK